jgi:hypothetical protein
LARTARLDDGVRREAPQGSGKDLLAHGGGGVREQYLADASGVQWETAAGFADYWYRRVPRD